MLWHPSWNRALMPPSEIRLPPEAVAAIARGELIQAIKITRAAAGVDLKEAKDAVDAYAAHPDARKNLLQPLGTKAEVGKLVFPQQAADALSRGAVIEAIKRVREANPQLGLKEAKDAVEGVVKQRPTAVQSPHAAQRVPTVVQGDSGRGGWVWLLAAVVAVAAWWWFGGR